MEKYEENGEVAVLVSTGYGAGWSTWNKKELAWDKSVVEFFLKHRDSKKTMTEEELKEAFKQMGYDRVYFGGYDNIEVIWVPKGTLFKIDEYDGFERVTYPDDYEWETA